MCYSRKKYSVLDSFETVDQIEKKVITISIKLREKFNICIIDDETRVIKLDGFRKLGYENVDLQGEAGKLEDYKDYDIILCDIHGVANDYSQDEEGLAFAKQLKKIYPCKQILIFTGQNVKTYGEPNGLTVLEKPMSSSTLSDVFDKCVKELLDPSYLWDSLYRYLVENNVKPKEIVKIEDNFVKSYKVGSPLDDGFTNNEKIRNTLENVARFIGIAAAAFAKEYASN